MESIPINPDGGDNPVSPRAHGPIPPHSTVYEFLKSKLDLVLSSSQVDKTCIAHAKTVSGFAGRVARNLFKSEIPPVEPHFVWDHIQCLQEYQVRQLVEQALFQGPDEKSKRAVPQDHTNPNPNPNSNPNRPSGSH